MFNFKHKINSRLKESVNKSSRPSPRASSGSKKSSGSTKSSTQLKLLQVKAKIAELQAEATFMMEKQKAEQQAKMLQLQGEFARAKARDRVYKDYNYIQSRASTKDEAEPDELKKNI